MPLLDLPTELLDAVLAAVFTRSTPSADRPRGVWEPQLSDTVFLALVSRRLNEQVRAVFARLIRPYVLLADGAELPPFRLVTSSSCIFRASPGAEGRRWRALFRWRHSGAVGATLLPFDTAGLPGYFERRLYPCALKRNAEYSARCLKSGHKAQRDPAELSFASFYLSPWARTELVAHAPIKMIVASFHCSFFAEDPMKTVQFDDLLVMAAAHHGRTDVLDLLVHDNPHAQRDYNSNRGLVNLLNDESNVVRGRARPPPIMDLVLLPAVLGDRADVLAWLRDVTTEVFSRKWAAHLYAYGVATTCGVSLNTLNPTGTSMPNWSVLPLSAELDMRPMALMAREANMRRLYGRQPFGPAWFRSADFLVLAVLAAQCGATAVLEWMYNDVDERRQHGFLAEVDGADRLRTPDGEHVRKRDDYMAAVRFALIVTALNGSLFVRDGPSESAMAIRFDAHEKRGRCARWAEAKWREWSGSPTANLQDLCCVLFEAPARRSPFVLKHHDHLWCALNIDGPISGASSHSILAALKALGLGLADPQALFDSIACAGDEDRARWLIEASRPGGFLEERSQGPAFASRWRAAPDVPPPEWCARSDDASAVARDALLARLVRYRPSIPSAAVLGSHGGRRACALHAMLEVYVCEGEAPNWMMIEYSTQPRAFSLFGSISTYQPPLVADVVRSAVPKEAPCMAVGAMRAHGLLLAARIDSAFQTEREGPCCELDSALVEIAASTSERVWRCREIQLGFAEPVRAAAARALRKVAGPRSRHAPGEARRLQLELLLCGALRKLGGEGC